MSSLENELTLLQEKDWSEKERDMIKSLTENIKYYRKLIPNSLKKDICEALNMCNELKIELDTYREFCKNKSLVYLDKKIVNDKPKDVVDAETAENAPNVVNEVIIISSSNTEEIIVDTFTSPSNIECTSQSNIECTPVISFSSE
jgi:hypothetical protein